MTVLPADGPTLVALRRVSKHLGGVRALDDVTIDLRSGEIVGLVGKNGAGKSTLVRVLAGAVSPDTGTVEVDGEAVTFTTPHDADNRGFAFVHQETTLVPRMTVEQNITLGRPLRKRAGLFVDRGAAASEAATALRRLGVDVELGAPVDTLTIAQQRMVMIARGLVGKSRLLVLDEPSASLTEEEITHLHQVIATLRAGGMCIVYISHRVGEVLSLTDRVVVMRDGRTVEDRPTSAFDRARLVTAISARADDLADRPTAELTPRRRAAASEAHAAAETVPLLEVRRVSSASGVRDVSFVVHAGEVLGVAGLVGSRRTELMRLLSGADRRAEGSVRLAGDEVRLRSPRAAMAAGIVMVPEDRRLQGNHTGDSIARNISLPNLGRMRGLRGVPLPSRRREHRVATDLVRKLQVASTGPRQTVGELSGGNQQKVVIAKWLLHDGRVFIFDEPAVGVDVGAKAEIFALVRALAEEGRAVVMVSSDFSEIVEVCDRAIVLREGELVAEVERGDLNENVLLSHCYGVAG